MRKLGLLFLLVLGVLAYGAYPYWSLYRLAEAVEIGDESALKKYVDWPAVRSGFKEDLSATLSRETGQAISSGDGEGLVGALIASAIGNALLDPIIDALVTPEGLAAVIREGRASEERARSDGRSVSARRDEPSLWQRLSFAFFTGPTTFEAVFETEGEENVVTVMRLNGTRWQLIRIQLPEMQLSAPGETLRSSPIRRPSS